MTFSPSICALVIILCTSGFVVTDSSEDLVASASNGSPLKIQQSLVNYITTAVLPDGESETRMRFGDIIVREASVIKKNEAGVRKGLLLRQVASGPHILQLIYKLGEGRSSRKEVMKLLECEMINDWGSADQFRNHFREDLKRAGTDLPVPPNHLDFLKSENSTGSNMLEDELSVEQLEIADGDVFDLEQGVEQFQNVSVRILRNDEVVGDLQRSFDMIAQQRHCRRFHRKLKKNAKHAKQGEDVSSIDDDEEVGEKPSRRVRREAFRVGIMPGTLWCGDGSLADKAESLGAHVGTDRCCREHDNCPFIIHGMTSNYGVFNYRMHTVSHCTCDERFRSCLKQTNTGSSNFVGKLFFNIVQTKCFVLKPERACSKRSWWGKCLKYDFKKQAHLREPLPY